MKSDIDLPMHYDTSRLSDYPPRLLIYLQQQASSDSNSPVLQVLGLDRRCELTGENFFMPYSSHYVIVLIHIVFLEKRETSKQSKTCKYTQDHAVVYMYASPILSTSHTLLI